jgi:hypothetical protein
MRGLAVLDDVGDPVSRAGDAVRPSLAWIWSEDAMSGEEVLAARAGAANRRSDGGSNEGRAVALCAAEIAVFPTQVGQSLGELAEAV